MAATSLWRGEQSHHHLGAIGETFQPNTQAKGRLGLGEEYVQVK